MMPATEDAQPNRATVPRSPRSGVTTFLGGLAVIGLLPAAVILFFLKLDAEGQVVVAGQTVGDAGGAGLFAAVLSMLAPLLLILPLTALSRGDRGAVPWWVGLGPLPLLLPALLAILAVGGAPGAAPFLALALLCVVVLNLTGWVTLLRLICAPGPVVVLYGGFWAASYFLDYLARYIAPYFELKAMALVRVVAWTVPQMGGGMAILDEYLQGGSGPWAALGPTYLQLALIGIIAWRLRTRHRASPPSQTEPSPDANA